MLHTSLSRKITWRVILLGSFALLIVCCLSIGIMTPILRESAIEQASIANDQIVQQADELSAAIKEFTETVYRSDSFSEVLSAYRVNPDSANYAKICLALANMAEQRKNVRAITVETENHVQFSSIIDLYQEDYDLLASEWYARIRDSQYGSGTSAFYPIQDSIPYTAAYAKNTYVAGQTITITVFMNISELYTSTGALVRDSLDAYAWMASSNDSPCWIQGDELWTGELLEEPAAVRSWKRPYRMTSTGISFVTTSFESGWRFVSYVSNETVASAYMTILLTVVLMLLIFYLLTIIVLLPMMNRMLRPLGALAASMQEVADGNMEAYSKIQSDDEIGQLSDAFNNMLRDIRWHMNNLLEKEKTEQRMRYNLLISQLDPHFIHNTMNCINYLARQGRVEDVIEVNTSLMYILRDSLRINEIEVTDALFQELEVVRRYLKIIKIRYGSAICVVWEIEEALHYAPVPKNILQPLVENAIFHGLAREDGEYRGTIWIRAYKRGEGIVLEVEDDGRGFASERLVALRSKPDAQNYPNERGRHIGLQNIQQRLQYLYGDLSCMEIENIPEKGARIRLRLGQCKNL